MRIAIVIILCIGFLLANPIFTFAEVSKGTSLSSDSFRILDSQQTIFGGTSSASSENFILTATIGGFAIGSASITNFGLRSGFLYYPKVTAPTLNTATAGDGQVVLSWTAASAFQGWTISGYNVCHKSTGSYTCASVGNVTSSTKTGLTNGTTYTFKIEAKDNPGNVIAESNTKTVAPVAATSTPSAGGGGGGGGYTAPAVGGTGVVIIKGTAYPKSTVNVFRDGVFVVLIKAGSDAKFEAKLENVSAGQRTIGINSTDSNGRKSITITFDVNIIADSTVTLSSILLPTTIDLSSFRLARGEILRVFGQSVPTAEVDVHISSKESITKTIADSNGVYGIKFDTQPLKEESHTAKSRSIYEVVIGPFSQVLQFIIGKGKVFKSADLNQDGKVHIVDFSILLYWWNTKKSNGLDLADINGDGRVNIVDFSILLFQWTG